MPIPVACPKCRKQYNLADQFLGKSVKCQACGTPFRVQAGNAAIANQATAAAVGSPNELAQLGLDGPIVRKSTDIFATAGRPASSAESLAHGQAFDPGFATPADMETMARQTALARPQQGSSSLSSTQGSVVHNPYATGSVALHKPAKQKLADIQAQADRILDIAEAHRGMIFAFVGAIGCNFVSATLIKLILFFNGYSIDLSKNDLGLSFEVYISVLIISVIALVSLIAIGVMFLKDLYRTSALTGNNTAISIMHVLMQFLPILGWISLYLVDRGARRELLQAGFKAELFGVPKSKMVIGAQSQTTVTVRKSPAWAEDTSRDYRAMLRWLLIGFLIPLIGFGLLALIYSVDENHLEPVPSASGNPGEFDLSLGLMVALIALGFICVAEMGAQLMCLLAIVKLAERLFPGQNQGSFHALLFFLPLGMLYSLISLSNEARKQLRTAGYSVGIMGGLVK